MNDELYEWIYNLTRFTKNTKALCVFGPPSSGKSLVTKMMIDINGPRFSRTISPNYLDSNFNAFLKETTLLIVDEVRDFDFKLIRDLSTNKELVVSSKGKENITINNRINFLLTYTTNAASVGIQNKGILFTKPMPALHILYELIRNINDA